MLWTAGAGTARAVSVETFAPPCVLVLGGGGTVTGNAEIDANWFSLNSVISETVVQTLGARGYAVKPLIIDVRDSAERFRALWTEFSKAHCTRTVQISHELKAKDGRLNAFSIHADVLHFKLSADQAEATPVADYKRAYDYPMDPETMQNLSLTDLGRSIADDLAASGALPR